MSDLFSVKGKVALVTGGRRGLGKAMVLGLAERGAKVAIAAQSKDYQSLQSELADRKADFEYFQVDLLNREQRKTLIPRVVSRFGQIDILVNNAGVQQKAPAMEYGIHLWDQDIELLLTSVLDLSQAAARVMASNGGGKIIHIASISSFQGARQIVGYVAAKHALVGLTKSMANEWAGMNINVNAIAPGIFETDMAADVFKDPARAAEMRGRVPSGRFGQPEDMVGPLLFLATDASKHVHGHVLLVDGGWMGR